MVDKLLFSTEAFTTTGSSLVTGRMGAGVAFSATKAIIAGGDGDRYSLSSSEVLNFATDTITANTSYLGLSRQGLVGFASKS